MIGLERLSVHHRGQDSVGAERLLQGQAAREMHRVGMVGFSALVGSFHDDFECVRPQPRSLQEALSR